MYESTHTLLPQRHGFRRFFAILAAVVPVGPWTREKAQWISIHGAEKSVLER